MSDIEFITNGYKIPLCLEVKVDGVSVTYLRYGSDNCFYFTVWTTDAEKAKAVVEKIVEQIIRERSDYKHFVSWRTESLKVIDTDERYGYITLEWVYYVRDSG
jgi:hypothetical protein